MTRSKNVRFIRVNGRIVPIINDKKKFKRGVKEAGVGAGVAMGAGIFSGRALKRAENIQKKAHESLFEVPGGSRIKNPLGEFTKARASYRTHSRLRSFGRFAGAAIFSAGVSNIIDSIGKRKEGDETSREAISFAGGLAAGGILNASSNLGAGSSIKNEFSRFRKSKAASRAFKDLKTVLKARF